MGVHCEIMMCNGKDSYIPGETVTGTIRYAVDKEMNFKQITTSLKGIGSVEIVTDPNNKDKKRIHWEDEKYVDIDNLHLKEDTLVPIGCYEIPFQFTIPHNVPPSVDYSTYTTEFNDRAKCKIEYYVRIKFEKSSTFSFSTRFKKIINVLPQIIPKQPMTPTVCGKEGKVTRLFHSGKNMVSIKSTIQSCVIKPEGQFNVNLEIENNTHVKIKYMKITLRQKYTFYATNLFRPVKKYKVVYETKTGQMESGETKLFEIDVHSPPDVATLEHARIVKRDYVLVVTAGIPFPHFDISYKIPVQIGYLAEDSERNTEVEETDDPPSYWEVMAEDEKKSEKE